MPYPRPSRARQDFERAARRTALTFAVVCVLLVVLFYAEGRPYAVDFGSHVHVFHAYAGHAQAAVR
jgi:hypothetical protein